MPDAVQKGSSLKSWLTLSRQRWAVLVEAGAWIFTVIATFILEPPLGLSPNENKTWKAFAKFITIILTAFVFVTAQLWGAKRYRRRWLLASVIFSLALLGSFFLYQTLQANWTCSYFGDSKVIGAELTIKGKDYLSKNPGASCEVLLQDFIGNTDDVWTKESLDRRRFALTLSYMACISLASCTVLSTLQAVRLAEYRHDEKYHS